MLVRTVVKTIVLNDQGQELCSFQTKHQRGVEEPEQIARVVKKHTTEAGQQHSAALAPTQSS